MQIYSVVFSFSRHKLKSKKYAKTINILCAGNKVLKNIKRKGGIAPIPQHAYALEWLKYFDRVWPTLLHWISVSVVAFHFDFFLAILRVQIFFDANLSL